jgi:hypothetical protein
MDSGVFSGPRAHDRRESYLALLSSRSLRTDPSGRARSPQPPRSASVTPGRDAPPAASVPAVGIKPIRARLDCAGCSSGTHASIDARLMPVNPGGQHQRRVFPDTQLQRLAGTPRARQSAAARNRDSAPPSAQRADSHLRSRRRSGPAPASPQRREV